MDFGSRITAWREHLGLTQKQLAKAIGVVPATVCMWESADYAHGPNRINLDLLLGVFGITLERFLGPLPKKKPARKRAA